MTTRIGLISDVHACAAPLREALSIFRQERVAMVLCAGDIAGYGTELAETVELLVQGGCTAIMGNHEVWYLDSPAGRAKNSAAVYLAGLPRVWESVREGIRVYAVHASPPQSLNKGIRLLDEKGGLLAAEKERWTALLDGYSFDVLIVGHTHQVFAERFGSRLVINPGSTKFNHTCMVLTLPDMDVRIFPLSGREPVKSWNWGMMTGRGLRAGKKIT